MGNVIIDGNSKITYNTTEKSNGGGIWSSGIVLIKNSLIAYNTALGYGGGILVGSNSRLEIEGGEISNNKTTNISSQGGAISGDTNSVIIIKSSIIKNNVSQYKDGGLRIVNENGFTYNMVVICENTPSNSYETHVTCPS